MSQLTSFINTTPDGTTTIVTKQDVYHLWNSGKTNRLACGPCDKVFLQVVVINDRLKDGKVDRGYRHEISGFELFQDRKIRPTFSNSPCMTTTTATMNKSCTPQVSCPALLLARDAGAGPPEEV